jgi:hypothetical protein
MKEITKEDFLALFDPDTHEAIEMAAKHTQATHLVALRNHVLDSSRLGELTCLCVGPTCTYKTPEDLEGEIVMTNGLPSSSSIAEYHCHV